MRLTEDTRFIDFLATINAIGLREDIVEKINDRAKSFDKMPTWLKVDYDSMPFGVLAGLQNSTEETFMNDAFRLLLLEEDYSSIDEVKLYQKLNTERFIAVWRFILDIKENLERISKLFEAIKHVPTKEEREAGIDRIEGSIHRVADWYSLRQGIPFIEDVYRIPWSVIYLAMKIDKEDNDLKARLRAKSR